MSAPAVLAPLPWLNDNSLTSPQKKSFSDAVKNRATEKVRGMPIYENVDPNMFEVVHFLLGNRELNFHSTCKNIAELTAIPVKLVEKHAVAVLSIPGVPQGRPQGCFMMMPGKTTICKSNIHSITQRGFHRIISTAMQHLEDGDAAHVNTWNALSAQYNAIHHDLFQAYQEVIGEISRKAENLHRNKAMNDQLREDRVVVFTAIGYNRTEQFGGRGGISAAVDKKNLKVLFPGFDSAQAAYRAVHDGKGVKSITTNLGLVGLACNILQNAHEQVIEETVATEILNGTLSPIAGKKRVLSEIDAKLEDMKPILRIRADPLENAKLMFAV